MWGERADWGVAKGNFLKSIHLLMDIWGPVWGFCEEAAVNIFVQLFCGDGNILYLDFCVGYRSVVICPNSAYCALEMEDVISCKLSLKKSI